MVAVIADVIGTLLTCPLGQTDRGEWEAKKLCRNP